MRAGRVAVGDKTPSLTFFGGSLSACWRVPIFRSRMQGFLYTYVKSSSTMYLPWRSNTSPPFSSSPLPTHTFRFFCSRLVHSSAHRVPADCSFVLRLLADREERILLRVCIAGPGGVTDKVPAGPVGSGVFGNATEWVACLGETGGEVRGVEVERVLDPAAADAGGSAGSDSRGEEARSMTPKNRGKKGTIPGHSDFT